MATFALPERRYFFSVLLPRGAPFGCAGAGAKVLRREGVFAVSIILGAPPESALPTEFGLSNRDGGEVSMMITITPPERVCECGKLIR